MEPYYAYRDYRVWLKDQFELNKQQQAYWSHRYIAQKMGLSSVGWFGDVLAGKRRLRGDQVHQLCHIFKWTGKTAEFFALLVEFAYAKQASAQNVLFQKMMTFVPSEARLLSDDHHAYFEHWVHSALRQHLLAHPFDGDFRALHKQLRPRVSMAQIKASLELLFRLGLVQQNAGRYSALAGHLKKDPQSNFLSFVNYQSSLSEVAVEMLQSVPKDERDYSSLTLHLDEQGLREAREEIAQLRQRLRHIGDASSKRSRPVVYQGLFQLFPLTQETLLCDN